MTSEQGSSSSAKDERRHDAVLGPAASAVAVVLILGFMALVGVMIAMRGDPSWERLVYIFGGYEALVFAGAGALFGTTVQRQNVSSARRDAKESSARAKAAERDASAGRALAGVVRGKKAAATAAKTKETATKGTAMRGLSNGSDTDGELDELTAIVNELFGKSDS